MATICEFGTAPEQWGDGFFGIGTITGTDQDLLSKFEGEDVRFIRGARNQNGGSEFLVMVQRDECSVFGHQWPESLNRLGFSSNTLYFCRVCNEELLGRSFEDLEPMTDEEREHFLNYEVYGDI